MNRVLKLIRIEDVARKTTLAKSTIWLKISQGDFIRPTRIGGISVWKESDVDAWIESQFQNAQGVIA
jgi:predicted DNA-binding transcriptional regulator AlpA